MGRCSVGRSTQKYTGSGGADLSSILAGHGDMIYANQNIEAANVSIGTVGHVLTVQPDGNVDWQVIPETETVLVTKYPPSALPLSGYTATASDIAFGQGPNDAFNGVIGNEGWHGPQNYQSYTNPPYKHVGSAVLGGVGGEWIKLELPSVMTLSYIKIAPRNDPGDLNSGQAPKDLTILGSNDNSSWTVITSATNLTPAPFGQFDQITAVATTGYIYYAVVVTRTGVGGGWVTIGELEFWGTMGSVAAVNLQQVTASNPQTNITVELVNQTTSLTASGNVLVTGNVTADTFYGSGVNLTGIALATDLTSIITNLSDNSSRISNIETSTIGDIIYSNATDTLTKLNIGQSGYVLQSNGVGPEWVDMSSTSGLPTPYTHGDILYATGTNTLAKLNIGTSGQVLKSDGTVPVWGTDVSSSSGTTIWTDTGVSGKIHYSSGNVGINTSTPTTDLQIGSNVNISDTNDDKLVITGNVYVSRNLRVIDEIKTFSLTTTQLLVKTVEVTAVRQSRNLVI